MNILKIRKCDAVFFVIVLLFCGFAIGLPLGVELAYSFPELPTN